VYGDEDMHSVVRQLCVDYMVFILLYDWMCQLSLSSDRRDFTVFVRETQRT